MNEINSLKEIAQEIVDSYEGKNIDDLGIVELSRLKRDYRALHKLNLELKNKSRFDENVDTADYDDISLESENLWTLVQKELPLIEDVLSRKAQLAMGKTTRRRDVMANKARNLSSIKKIGDVLADLQAAEKNAGSNELKSVYASPVNALKTALKEMLDYDKKCDDEIEELGKEIDILRMGGTIPEYERVKTHDEELLQQVEAEKREIVERSNGPKRFILDNDFRNGYDEDLNVTGEIEKPVQPAKDEVFPVPDEIDYTKDDAFRFGYISNRGKFVADDAFKNGYAAGDPLYVRDDAFKYGYVDNKGKFVADDAFKDGYLKEGKYIRDDAFKFGYITKTGKWVNDDAFKNGYINADNRYIADDAFKYGFITLDSRFVEDDAFKNGYINDKGDFVEDKDLKFGYMNKSGEYVADNAFANGYINSDNQYVADDAFKFGYLNTKGEFVADNSFKNGYSVEEKRENTGFILVGDTFKDEYPENKGLNVEEKSGEEEKEPTALVALGATAIAPVVGAAIEGDKGTPEEPEEESTKTVVVTPIVEKQPEEAVEEFPAEEEKIESFPEEEEKIEEFPVDEKVEPFPTEEEEDDDKTIVAPLPRTKVITKKPAKTKLLARFTAVALAAIAVLSAYMAGKNNVFSKSVAAKVTVDEDEEEENKTEEFGKGDEVVKPTPSPKPSNPPVAPQPYYPPSDPGPSIPDTPVVPSEPDTPVTPEEPGDGTFVPDDPEVPDGTFVPDDPEVPDGTFVPDDPEIPDGTFVPDDPEVPDGTFVPDDPGTPDGTFVPDEPSGPEVPDGTFVPDEPTTPEVPDGTFVPDEPATPEVPDGTFVPDEPSVPGSDGSSILIDEGEAAIDLNTGVEEVHDSTIYDHSGGETTIPSGQDPTPTYTDDGAAVITPDDLQSLPEPPAPPEEAPGTLADAQEQLSADEFDNLISAFNDEFVADTPANSAPAETQFVPDEPAPVEVPSYEAPTEAPSYEEPTDGYEFVPDESGPTLTLSN